MADDICYVSGCPEPGKYQAQIRWTGVLGSGTSGLMKPVAFCEGHARSLRRAAPNGAVWLNEPDDEPEN